MRSIKAPYRLLALSLSVGMLSLGSMSWAQKYENDISKSQIAAASKLGESMPMIELQPELDTDIESPDADSDKKPSAEIPAQQAPIKAKAVVVDINSKTLNYDRERDVYVATGAVHVVISEQNSELFADQIVYDQNQNLLIADGHVTIYKNGQKTLGTYAKIDLTRQSALVNDINTVVDKVRIKAQQSMLSSANNMIFENGRLIIDPQMMAAAMGKGGDATPRKTAKITKEGKPNKEDKQAEKLAKKQANQKATVSDPNDPNKVDDLASLAESGKALAPQETVDLSTSASQEDDPGLFHLKAKQIDIYRWKDGYSKIDMKKPAIYMGKFKVATLSNGQFSSDPNTNEIDYLGPDVGYDPDLGGLYYGPGYDFRLGNGSVRFSPLISYGGGGRRMRGGQQLEQVGNGPGIGGIIHYRGDDTMADLSYNSRIGQPNFYGEKKLFDGKTKFRMSANEDYNNGFMGFERPRYGMMLSDTRKIAQWGNVRLDTFSSLGAFKDEYFPTNQNDFFVETPESKPRIAGRVQFQAQLMNEKPILRVGNVLSFGFRAQIAGAGYSTGDMIGIIRGGPNMNVRLGNRFQTGLQYYFAQTAGETPFVFDTYYQGRSQVGWVNSLRVNDYLTVGTRSQISTQRDNAKNALFTGNQIFVLTGPKHFKFNLAYDVIRQRSYFGVSYLPGKNTKPIDFDTMRVFSPDQYSNNVAKPEEYNAAIDAGNNTPIDARYY